MDYLQLGLVALSRAHRANSMSGHLGAPLVAVELLLADLPDLASEVADGLHHELDLIMAGEESWFEPDKAGVTVAEIFEDRLVDGDPVPLDPLPASLAKSIDELRQSGHNVIFTALALRGLRLRPELATAGLVDGIRRLLDLFRTTGPGRAYLGADKGWVDPRSLPLGDDPEPYADETDMVHRTLEALVAHASSQRQGLGGLHHIINHAAALVDLRRLGYGDLAERGRPVHREHVRRWVALPDLSDELGARTLSTHDPLTPAFWSASELDRGSALLSHRPKTIYGFEVLASAATDSQRVAAARPALRYLV